MRGRGKGGETGDKGEGEDEMKGKEMKIRKKQGLGRMRSFIRRGQRKKNYRWICKR